MTRESKPPITIEPVKRDTAPVTLAASDLQGGAAFCPNPKMALWNTHPRVFIPMSATGEGKCPYCGTHYRLAGGARAGGH